MQDARKIWLDVVAKYKLNPDQPGGEKYWCPELETLSVDKLKEIQSEKLEAAFRYLFDFSPFYKEKFKRAKLTPADIKSIEDLPKIPITRKQEWIDDQAQNPPWGTFSPLSHETWTKRGWMFFATSGTTAAPRAFRHTVHDRDMWAWIWARALWAAGVRPGDILINCFGYGPFVAFWGAHYGMNLLGCPVIPGGGLDTKRRALFIQLYKPTVLICTPSYALFLAETMKELGYDPAESSISRIITAGEPGPCVLPTKERIERTWNATLTDIYGCTEAAMAPLGYECVEEALHLDRAPNIHLMEDVYIPEAVDPETLEPLPDGERGLSIVSNLFSEAQPILRYEIGDFFSITREPCECGRTHARAVAGFKGRADDMTKFRGIVIFPSTIESVVRGIKELGNEFQVVLTKERGLDVMTIKVEPQPEIGVEHYPEIQRKVADAMAAQIGVKANVEVHKPGSLPRTEFKARRVSDLRSQ